jgi:hypothetical protein
MFDFDNYKRLLDECYEFNKKLANKLFPDYLNDPIGFLYDGPIEPERWDLTKPKILFFAFETYGYWNCPPREIWDKKYDFSPRLYKIIAWLTYLITEYFDKKNIFLEAEAEDIFRNNEKLLLGWKKSCFIEAKKISSEDNSGSNTENVLYHANENKTFLIKQISMLNPDIIYCCSTRIFNFVIDNFNLIDLKNYTYNNNQWCYKALNNKIIINSPHPSWRFFKKYDAYLNIINEIKTFFK